MRSNHWESLLIAVIGICACIASQVSFADSSANGPVDGVTVGEQLVLRRDLTIYSNDGHTSGCIFDQGGSTTIEGFMPDPRDPSNTLASVKYSPPSALNQIGDFFYHAEHNDFLQCLNGDSAEISVQFFKDQRFFDSAPAENSNPFNFRSLY